MLVGQIPPFGKFILVFYEKFYNS